MGSEFMCHLCLTPFVIIVLFKFDISLTMNHNKYLKLFCQIWRRMIKSSTDKLLVIRDTQLDDLVLDNI